MHVSCSAPAVLVAYSGGGLAVHFGHQNKARIFQVNLPDPESPEYSSCSPFPLFQLCQRGKYPNQSGSLNSFACVCSHMCAYLVMDGPVEFGILKVALPLVLVCLCPCFVAVVLVITLACCRCAWVTLKATNMMLFSTCCQQNLLFVCSLCVICLRVSS